MEGKTFEPLDTFKSSITGVYVEDPSRNPRFNKDLDWEPGMLPGSGTFDPIRLVVELEVDKPDDPINFRVYLSHTDATYGASKLAKWNGSEWIGIDAPLILIRHNPIWAGYFDVKNYKLGDPSIAVGR